MAGRVHLGRLERALRIALRHAPPSYGLAPDERGFVPVAVLLAALRVKFPALQEEDIRAAIAARDVERFEMIDGRIRALFGHTIPVSHLPDSPPPLLYHATSPAAAAAALREGLRPIRRRYVHLTADPTYARSAAVAVDVAPELLIIRAALAHAAGVRFYGASPIVWLADALAAAFIERACELPAQAADVIAERIRAAFDDEE